MIHRRPFAAAFTAQVVLELLTGAKSRAECCREQQLASSVRAAWKTIWRARLASIVEPPDQRTHHDSARSGLFIGLYK